MDDLLDGAELCVVTVCWVCVSSYTQLYRGTSDTKTLRLGLLIVLAELKALADDKEAQATSIWSRRTSIYQSKQSLGVLGCQNCSTSLRYSVLGHFLSILDKAAHSCRYGSSVELTDRVKAWHGCLCVPFGHLPVLPKDSNI